VGDPFKDTSSVAMNPVIKFTTLFGLLAVELAVSLAVDKGAFITYILAGVFFAASVFFILRSFYSMRIGRHAEQLTTTRPPISTSAPERPTPHPVGSGQGGSAR
jgi:K(+)-stimulated pyrophosphate-energized sodium pump